MIVERPGAHSSKPLNARSRSARYSMKRSSRATHHPRRKTSKIASHRSSKSRMMLRRPQNRPRPKQRKTIIAARSSGQNSRVKSPPIDSGVSLIGSQPVPRYSQARAVWVSQWLLKPSPPRSQSVRTLSTRLRNPSQCSIGPVRMSTMSCGAGRSRSVITSALTCVISKASSILSRA
jgi:hypothetical protein